jgi:formylglycine-generating enzyme required for sulfatase activity
MKKTIISAFSLLLIGAAGVPSAYAQKPKLAVLVVGLESDAASDAFATGIGYEATQKGLYEVVTAANNTAVKAMLTALRTKHANNETVDTAGLAAWGKEKGLDFVQLVVENDCSITIGNSAPVTGREQLSQVVSCGTAKYSGRPTSRTRFVPNFKLGTELDEMVFVVGGVFEMGCKSDRDGTCGSNGETPVHHVKVNNFYIGKYEVTQALWKKVMGSGSESNWPKASVSWNNITGSGGFLETLNMQTGKNYRLPTEAEWEYAARGCRGGACEDFMYSGSNTIEDVAWYKSNSGKVAHLVGTKAPNRLGLYDMTGNVYEWCYDWHSDSYYSSSYTASNPQDNPTGPINGTKREQRGGSWYEASTYCRSAFRYGYFTPSGGSDDLGFRLVLPAQ